MSVFSLSTNPFKFSLFAANGLFGFCTQLVFDLGISCIYPNRPYEIVIRRFKGLYLQFSYHKIDFLIEINRISYE